MTEPAVLGTEPLAPVTPAAADDADRPVDGPGLRRRLVASAASGLLLAAAFPPLDLGPIALVALIPLLWAWRGAGPRLGALCGATAGVAFFGMLVSWTWYFGSVAYVPFVVFLSGWWALAGAVVGWLDRRGAAAAPVVAAVWVLVEAGRARWPFGGFSWGEVGYAFHDVPVARSVAAWGGVLLVSFVAVAVNALGLRALLARGRRPALRRAAGGLAGVLAACLAAHVLLPELPATGVLQVALVQGNDLNRDLTPAEVADRYLSENHLRLANAFDGPADLVVLPESGLEVDPRLDPQLDRRLTALADRHDAVVFAGGNTDAPGGRLYNTTFMYEPSGRSESLYRKRHLVPFGEFVPWRSRLSFIDALQGVPRDYEPGTGRTLFPVAGHPIGTLICFESAFGPMARDYARNGAEAIVVSTNNRSYRRSANSAQHLAMAQMRAAEIGRPVLQAAISGISGVIDSSGHLVGRTELFEPTVLAGEVTTRTGRTPYVAVGEWILALAAAVVVAAGVSAARRGRRTPPGRVLDSRP